LGAVAEAAWNSITELGFPRPAVTGTLTISFSLTELAKEQAKPELRSRQAISSLGRTSVRFHYYPINGL
jgi:hypothetical protein